MKLARFAPIAAMAAVASCSDSTVASVLNPNGVAYSFVVVGCNRVDKADTLGNVSTANVEQLKKTFADVAALPVKPKFIFFAGDEVFGYTADTVALARELTAWKGLYEASPLAGSGIELVAIPGNHEVQSATKVAYAAAERTWLRVMANYVTHSGDGPVAGGADALQTDQSHLTYSFDYKDAHFVTINSDPTGMDWHVPTQWVKADLAAAQARGAKHIFAIAHKPAYPYPTLPTDGLSQDPVARDAFWKVLTDAKTEAMISAHNHLYYRTQPANNKTWMVIAGNGGSKLDAGIDPTIPTTGAYYGFTLLSVANNGHVMLKSYGRDIPAAGYTASAANTPTTVRDSADITWQ